MGLSNLINYKKSINVQIGVVLLAVSLFAVACMTNEVTGADGDIETSHIAAKTASCQGVTTMRCLIVNGQIFYESIDGYMDTNMSKANQLKSARLHRLVRSHCPLK